MSETEFFNQIDLLIKEESPFVFYRKPKEKEVVSVIQKDDALHLDPDLTEKGFVFFPFDLKDKKIIFPYDQCKIKVFSLDTKDVFINSLDLPEKVNNSAKEKFISLIERGLEVINSGEISKVVLSRAEEVLFPEKKIGEIYKDLLNRYPGAFVYVWFHPGIGLWMGATPETLLTIRKGKFTTMALAGTRPFKDRADIVWGKKEKQEQQFVTDYILSELDREKLEVGRPYTLRAGSLQHICTDIKGEISKKNNLRNLVGSLHPTPAVCGLPGRESFEFILNNEDYKRSYYTGFLGEINTGPDNDTDLFVNLRCMKIDINMRNRATLYVGGGITSGSVPLKEWEETVEKSMIMKSVLF